MVNVTINLQWQRAQEAILVPGKLVCELSELTPNRTSHSK